MTVRLRMLLLCAVIAMEIAPMASFSFPTPTTTTSIAAPSMIPGGGRLTRHSACRAVPYRFTQVVSDVDDTLKSSGGLNVAGVFLGGIDVQYPRGQFYPGVGEFMLGLSLRGLPPGETPAKIAILTARAEELKAALEIKKGSKLAVALRRAGESVGIDDWGVGPVLYGSVVEWIDQSSKGLRKFTNFEKLIRQDPSGSVFRYVYVGDTGELDQEAGEAMLREYPDLVRAVFLHVVTDDPKGPASMPGPKLVNGRPVVFFRTYVGAASDAVRLGLMDPDGLRSVIEASLRELRGVPETSSKWTDLLTDLARADSVLRD